MIEKRSKPSLVRPGCPVQMGASSKTKYKQRHKVENMFGKLKDWRRIAPRYDRRVDVFMAAITLAAIVIWWI